MHLQNTTITQVELKLNHSSSTWTKTISCRLNWRYWITTAQTRVIQLLEVKWSVFIEVNRKIRVVMLLHKYNYNFTDATYVIALLQYFGLVNKFLFRNSMCCHISAKKTIIDISASVTWRPPKILSRCLRWGGEDEVRTGRAHLGRARWGGEDRSGSPRRSEVRTGRAHLGGRASCGWSPGGGRPPRRWRGRAGRRRRCASRGTCLGSASSSCRTTSSWLAGSGSMVNARTTGQRMMDRWQQQQSQWEDNGW